jgi:hypothetical protein
MTTKSIKAITEKMANVLEIYNEVENTLKVKKFEKSNIGRAMTTKLRSLETSEEGIREMILTNKNNILALLLDASNINVDLLEQNTSEATNKAREEIKAL